MRHENRKHNKRRKKHVIIICMVLAAAVLVCVFLWLANIRQQRTEAEHHLALTFTHVRNGTSDMIAVSERIIAFYSLIERAEGFAENSNYDVAISVYEEAKLIADALTFSAGAGLAESGIEQMHERIIIAKRIEAMNLFFEGDALYKDSQYEEALEYLYRALELYLELEDQQNIILTKARIDYSEQRLAELENDEHTEPDDTYEEPEEPEEKSEVLKNYEHNINIEFDLRTLIDYQNRSPANLIRMGSSEGMNEGWYNGCGWIAAYNALILLGTPEHPAEIVRHFEQGGGTVFGGVFGTYPNAIENYLSSLGYNVNHTLFPQVNMSIDDIIKASRVSILAYVHTAAAHYVAIEYREDIDQFVVYNDSFARAYSANPGLHSDTGAGAVIDSVSAFIMNTPKILFSFSLITVN